jgi:hypothetical protein
MMTRRTTPYSKVVFSTRLEPEIIELLRQWASAERRSLSDQIAILIEQEQARRIAATRDENDQQ